MSPLQTLDPAILRRVTDGMVALPTLPLVASRLLEAVARDEAASEEVARIIASENADFWQRRFEGQDVCCCVVASIEEALADAHFAARGVFDRSLTDGARSITALPVPVDDRFRGDAREAGYPALGEANAMLEKTRDGPHSGR